MESHVSRKDNDRQLKISWNYKPQGTEWRKIKEVPSSVQALIYLVHEVNNFACMHNSCL
jgi:hypothetical protein